MSERPLNVFQFQSQGLKSPSRCAPHRNGHWRLHSPYLVRSPEPLDFPAVRQVLEVGKPGAPRKHIFMPR